MEQAWGRVTTLSCRISLLESLTSTCPSCIRITTDLYNMRTHLAEAFRGSRIPLAGIRVRSQFRSSTRVDAVPVVPRALPEAPVRSRKVALAMPSVRTAILRGSTTVAATDSARALIICKAFHLAIRRLVLCPAICRIRLAIRISWRRERRVTLHSVELELSTCVT